jgi:hypothetical protein
MAPLDPAKKAILLKRLAEGRAKAKAARSDAKEKGMPDPKPRKPRVKKGKMTDTVIKSAEAAHEKYFSDPKNMKAAENNARGIKHHAEPVDPAEALVNPSANKPARESIPPIDGAPPGAKNVVSAMAPAPEPTMSSKIDVPNLPDAKGRKKIVKDAEEKPEAQPINGLSTTGVADRYNDNKILMNQETGAQAIPVQYPGQEESLLKLLKKNKKENKPLAPLANPTPKETTVDDISRHVPDLKSVEGRAPFSFAAIRKQLYQ